MISVMYTRPPFYAALLKPLAFLPYLTAYAVFSVASLASFIWFVLRFSEECPSLPLFAAMSVPAITALCDGQDTPFLLVILGVSILFTRKNRDFAAGLVLALCAIKFHLFLFVALLLLAKKRWRILGGAICGTLALTGLGLLVAGAGSMGRYVQVLRDPWINSSATLMPNLHGLVATLHGGTRLELLFVAIVLLGFIWMLIRTDNYEFLLAESLVCGLLVSFHSGIIDDVILLPVFVSVVATSSSVPLRATAALILAPVGYFMVLADAPYSAFFPIAMLLFLGVFCTAAGTIREPAPG
jgi:hypothetical protein